MIYISILRFIFCLCGYKFLKKGEQPGREIEQTGGEIKQRQQSLYFLHLKVMKIGFENHKMKIAFNQDGSLTQPGIEEGFFYQDQKQSSQTDTSSVWVRRSLGLG